MNLFVQPWYVFKCPSVDTAVSIALITVVPTAQTRRSFVDSFINDYSTFLVDCCFFRIHLVFRQILYLNWSESSQSNMQSHLSKIDSFQFQSFQQLTREVQACSWGRNSTFFFRKNCLITLFIRRFNFSFDVFWKRCFPKFSDFLFEFFALGPSNKKSQSSSSRSCIVDYLSNQ